jgi:hypothetical protein
VTKKIQLAVKTLDRVTRSLLWRTGIGRRVAEYYWHNQSEGQGFQLLYSKEQKVFDKIPTHFANAEFKQFIEADSAVHSMQQEFVLVVNDVLLEPERLLGIRNGRQVVEQTVVYKHDRQYPYIIPYILGRHKAQAMPAAILYDGSATRNYFHHFVDALSQLTLLTRPEVPPGLPLLITRAMFEQSFYQYLYERSTYFRGLNWRIVEPDEWLRVGSLYKLQAIQWLPTTWQRMRAIYELPERRPSRRVFLNRDHKLVGRCLGNEQEIEAILHAHGFETIYAERLSIAEQAQLFQDTEYLVALHGAGLIQQFFMNPRYGQVLEIMPQNRLMPLYYWQSYTQRMRYYDAVIGGPMEEVNGQFYHLDAEMFKTALVSMISNISLAPVYGCV